MVEFCVLSDIHVSMTRFKQINENLKSFSKVLSPRL